MIDFNPLCPPADPRARARNFAERQLHFVDDDEQIDRLDLEVAQQPADRLAARIHERQRLGQQRVAGPPRADQRLDRRGIECRRSPAAPARRAPRSRCCAASRGTSRRDFPDRRSASRTYFFFSSFSSSSSSFLPFLMTSGSAGAVGAATAAPPAPRLLRPSA